MTPPFPRYVVTPLWKPGWVESHGWGVLDRVTDTMVHRCRSRGSAMDKARARNALERAAQEKRLTS